jgi:hypothetical protein
MSTPNSYCGLFFIIIFKLIVQAENSSQQPVASLYGCRVSARGYLGYGICTLKKVQGTFLYPEKMKTMFFSCSKFSISKKKVNSRCTYTT